MPTSGSAGFDLVAVGMNHTTAPVDVRERLAQDRDGMRRQLAELRADGAVEEALLVSTCNRVELYAVASGGDRLHSWLDSFRGPRGESIGGYLYWHQGRDAVRHLFRVASALDSLVLGEPQILGQVKTAIREAQEEGSLGRVLHRLSHRSLSVAKRIRNETELGQSRVGVGNAGVDLALQVFGTLRGKRAMLVGTGEMGRQVARALLNSGLEELVVANRTLERAVEVARDYDGTPIAMERMPEYLARVDVVVTATGAVKPILGQAEILAALRARRWKPLFLVDLAVPRNIHPSVDDLDQAYLFNVDDLRQVVDSGLEKRQAASVAAMALVEEEADRFLQTLAVVDVGPRIGSITHAMEAVRMAEIERSKRLVEGLDAEQRAVLDALTRALVKKSLHGPLTAIREAAKRGDKHALEALLGAYGEAHDD